MIKSLPQLKINAEQMGGILLIGAALLALALDNSGLAWIYDSLLSTPFSISLGEFGLNKPLLLWINDGLMAIFFFMVGMEVKKEILAGELTSIRKASLPIIAALGGVVAPALIYLSINMSDTFAMGGWAIPVATDIAFALGILAIVGDRVPKELKILLMSLAIIDDIAAIVIIALFYTDTLATHALLFAAGGLTVAIALNRFKVQAITPYVVIGLFIWVWLLKSGVHATLAGVLLAMCIPLNRVNAEKCPLRHTEHALRPLVYFVIMPIFAFANAGLNLSSMSWDMIFEPIPLGIILGLFIGKQLGVFSFIWVSAKLKICQIPANVTWSQIYAMAILTGVGFTMSLFIGTLAYEKEIIEAKVRLGVLIGSLLSGAAGFIVLRYTTRNNLPVQKTAF